MAMITPIRRFLAKLSVPIRPLTRLVSCGSMSVFTQAVNAPTASVYTCCAASSSAGLSRRAFSNHSVTRWMLSGKRFDSTRPITLEITCGSTIENSAPTSSSAISTDSAVESALAVRAAASGFFERFFKKGSTKA